MYRIIIVDNHPLISMALGSLLTSYGHEIVAIETTGESAMRSALQLQPDLLILDLYLPDYHGLEVARGIKDTGMKTKIIAFTAHDDMNYQRKCKELGIEGFMLKNELSDTLVKTVESVMSGEIFYPYSPLAADASRAEPIDVKLTRREKSILKYLASGMTNRDIARTLDISDKTVSTHKRRIMTKFKVDSLVGLLSKVRAMMDKDLLN